MASRNGLKAPVLLSSSVSRRRWATRLMRTSTAPRVLRFARPPSNAGATAGSGLPASTAPTPNKCGLSRLNVLLALVNSGFKS